jgi:serine/threonine protein kinase
MLMTSHLFFTDLFIVMNYMDGGSLARRIANKGNPPITEEEARIVMARLFSALAYIHNRGFVHRNVKPENILLEQALEPRWPETVRLSDFRMACYLDSFAAPSAEAAEFANQVVGTPDYLAPEAAVMTTQADGSRKPCVGPETDMWAAGVTLYNILSNGQLPFLGATTPEVLRNARHSAVKFEDPAAFGLVSLAAKSVIRALLNPDRRKRPSAESVLHHPWFVGLHPRQSVLSRPANQLRGLEKMRAVVLCVRFLYRIGAASAGFPKFVANRNMRFVSHIATVDVSPTRITFAKGVDIAPTAPERGFRTEIISPFEFTTSTLSPTPTEALLRTSQTSSVASFRSSQSSSHVDLLRQQGNPRPNGSILGGIFGAIRRDSGSTAANVAEPNSSLLDPSDPSQCPHRGTGVTAESTQSTLSHVQPVCQSPQDESMASVSSSEAESRRSAPPSQFDIQQLAQHPLPETGPSQFQPEHDTPPYEADLEPEPLLASAMVEYGNYIMPVSTGACKQSFDDNYVPPMDPPVRPWHGRVGPTAIPAEGFAGQVGTNRQPVYPASRSRSANQPGPTTSRTGQKTKSKKKFMGQFTGFGMM